MHKETILAQAGLCSDQQTGAISTPIYQTATFRHPELGKSTGYDYSRTANPTRHELETVLARLESGDKAFAFASGMNAITALPMLFQSGDHFIISDDLYGGTWRLFEQVFQQFGLTTTYINTSDITRISEAIRPETKAIFIETPTNPMMKISDLNAVAALAKTYQLTTIVDNTFMTPYLQRPLELGVDLVVHSGSKYLGGHHDVICGFVVSASPQLSARIGFIQNSTGGGLAPFDSWLVLRGLKTLALRLERAQENATTLASWLSRHPRITHVFYPGLPDHPGRDIHFSQASGPGAVVSFKVESSDLVPHIINRVKVISFAESLGGVESLITFPALQTHADIPLSMREAIGITDDLLRLSVGIENIDDLIHDLDQAIGG